MKNIGTGDAEGQSNRVFLLGRDTKPGPGLRIVPAPVQPVDVDPRSHVRRIVHMPLTRILEDAKRGLHWHPAPQLVARPGERVEVVIANHDDKIHSFTVGRAKATTDVFEATTQRYAFTVPRPEQPNSYRFYCAFGAPGMNGWLVVRGPPVSK